MRSFHPETGLICGVYIALIVAVGWQGWPSRLPTPKNSGRPISVQSAQMAAHAAAISEPASVSDLEPTPELTFGLESTPALSTGTGKPSSRPVTTSAAQLLQNQRIAELRKPTPVTAHILMYHYVRVVDPKLDPEGYRLSVTASQLDNDLTALQAAGYSFITMADLAAGRGSPKKIAVTFDDGYADAYTTAYPILVKHRATATFFIISGKVGQPAYMSWDEIRTLHRRGFEIGAHTLHHPDLSRLTTAAQQKEIEGSKLAIEAQIGAPLVSFCYPAGRFNADTLHLVQEDGFLTATTTEPGAAHAGSDPYLLPRVRVSPTVTPTELVREVRS
ncbi:polysaccharide deacetylase family protein [Patescibacteria group bacterium]|nr:polysaccharide deacetylase family protein [Patescibacteria group bacterium]